MAAFVVAPVRLIDGALGWLVGLGVAMLVIELVDLGLLQGPDKHAL